MCYIFVMSAKGDSRRTAEVPLVSDKEADDGRPAF